MELRFNEFLPKLEVSKGWIQSKGLMAKDGPLQRWVKGSNHCSSSDLPRWGWLFAAATAPQQDMGGCAGTAKEPVPSQLRWLADRSSSLLPSAGAQSSPCHFAGSVSTLWLAGGSAESMPLLCWDEMVLSPCWRRHNPQSR